ncbi:cellulose binding domain-containing protein [Actinoplanes teichomyceticus]|uniref:Alpha-L-arabinofuranosidase n=1 Tax=Actinoplanes teichomyceticus TaxID=1867 RepID=A0A561WBG4_ACTTI|nr:cellulose binding domain-containing protein [Actinoplanes teichomyceticus]TWG21183.1 alpha-L-arabinofuranosidase [Actinoplanes teichomyceticus]GIF15004.1 alpha-L-arabinofuranosidase [Actinoplanes teichomyceticus]
MHIPTLRRALASTVLLAAVTATAIAPPGAHAAGPATDTRVDVDVRAGLATVGNAALGVNHAIWDAQLGTSAVAELLQDAGVRMLRYPGGSYADIYHWRDHTAPGGYVAPGTDFDTFMAAAQRTGAEPMIIANYGTGTAEEAADWVRYANVTKNYDATYWTIGNENYGNGHYGSAWEADEHADKSPEEYAATVVAYSRAMKAVDPTIKVGAVLTMPGNWPDGIVGAGDQGTWNQEVLTRAGAAIDFVDVHWYPGGTTPAETLTTPAHIRDAVHLLRQQIDRYAGGDAGRIGISMTETNVEIGRNTQPGALFLADVYSGLLAQGVFTVHWWNVHNGIGDVTTVAGHPDYDDYGLLSSGNCTADNSVCQPPLNTPFAPYHALSLIGDLARTGDRFVGAGTDNELVSAHAVRRANGDVAVLLINKDPDAAHTVALNYQGFTPAAAAPAVATFTNGADGVTTTTGGTAAAQTLAPYSLTLVTLHPARAETAGPKAPAQPTATVTDRTATMSWPAAGSGLKYEVYRQNGGTAELLGETTGTSLTARNLEPGRRYTVNVLARDAAGRVSPPSPPLTFTTGTPADAACTVTFRDTNDWGNGFVGSIDITNNTAAAVAGWTLAFTWPTGWQSVSSGWNATWAQSGRTVRVTGDAGLAAGASTSVGFVGSYSGPNVLPRAFTLNGTVCTTK